MSGGEQQMVAIGRALMSQPEDPDARRALARPARRCSTSELFRSLAAIGETGVGILLVEQNARQSLAIADRAYLLENGRIVGEGSAATLLNDPAVQQGLSRRRSEQRQAAATANGRRRDASRPRPPSHERTPAAADLVRARHPHPARPCRATFGRQRRTATSGARDADAHCRTLRNASSCRNQAGDLTPRTRPHRAERASGILAGVC